MKVQRRKIFILVVFVYVAFSLYAAYNVFFSTKVISRVHRVVNKKVAGGTAGGPNAAVVAAPFEGNGEWNPWEKDQADQLSALQRRRDGFRRYQEHIDKPKSYKVQIWGKAAISLYLWEHILDGALSPADTAGQWRGDTKVGKIDFSFYWGPTVVPGRVPLDTDSVVVVLNGREQQKISFATEWLQHVQDLVRARSVSHVAVVLLGSELCNNDWISPFLKRHGGFVDILFLVYDSPWVNDKDVFQWPLGVATYRQFPVVTPNTRMVSARRPYLCNFLGTVYKNSSRETLMGVLKQAGLEKDCITITRENWAPQETADSLQLYQTALAQSELTLCPVGVNSECYRVYEACAYGSLPVLEDVLTPGGCAGGHASPLRLLKAYGAPFIFLKDWRELPGLLEEERRRSQAERSERRRRLLDWYSNFRLQMKERFAEVLEEAFFKNM